MTWDELRKHAEFPRAAVTTHHEQITIPTRTFDCVVYVVDNSAAGEFSPFYFAKNIPGAPILFFTQRANARVMTNTLTKYVPGTGG